MTSTLHLTSDHIAKLQTIAERLGYVAERGAATGKGSASALIRAIADGDVIVISKRPDPKLAK